METRDVSLPNATAQIGLLPEFADVGPPDAARRVFGDPARMGNLTPGVVVVVAETPADPARNAAEVAVANFAMLRTDFTVLEIDGVPTDMSVLSVYRQGVFSVVSVLRAIAVGDVVVSIEVLCVIEEFSDASSWIRRIPADASVAAREPSRP